jgi:microsomal dipeptidase-like Zn-dependent dipeptidase
MNGDDFPGLTDVHAHPAMNAFLWDRDLRRHYWTGKTFDPLASLSDFKMLRKGGVEVLWSSLHIPERQMFECKPLWLLAHLTSGGRKLLNKNAWECLLVMMSEMERQVGRTEDFEIARSNAELDRVRAARHTAVVHTVEGGYVLGAGLEPDDLAGRLDRVKELADRGVASMTLVHFFPNELAGQAEAMPSRRRRRPAPSASWTRTWTSARGSRPRAARWSTGWSS